MSFVAANEFGRVVRVGTFVPSEPNHPTMPMPDEAGLSAIGPERIQAYLAGREAALKAEKDNPVFHGWEPPMWRIADALCEFPWVDKAWAADVRRKLGFPSVIRKLLMNGGNRGGKTQYCVRRMLRLLLSAGRKRAWMFHETHQMSVDNHQNVVWEHLPFPDVRRQVRSEVEYITFNYKNGFTDDKLVLANGSDLVFRNYEQSLTSIEGGEVDLVVADEHCPVEVSRTLDMRVATRGGTVLHPFTPTLGYTPLVADFREGATCVLDSAGWLLPLDREGAPDKARAVEVADVFKDLERGLAGGSPGEDARAFRRVPRVERCPDPRKAVVFIHTSDNPYGNPAEVRDIALGGGRDFVLERYYGVATKSAKSRFALDDAVHIVPPSRIPEKGANYFVTDPESSRNWFMLWARVQGDEVYIYREWPCPGQLIPGVGNPGVWAEFDGKKPDGKRGPAQVGFDFGLLRYKEEIARLEGWHDAEFGADGRPKGGEDRSTWSEWRGARERISRRIVDSRFASTQRLENDRPVTLITELERAGMFFETAPGASIDDGCKLIVDRLYWKRSEPLGFLNKPRLFISSDCRNLIHSLKTWTGMDGNKGASKDPIDCLRYLLTADISDFGGDFADTAEETRRSRRGCY